jgi:hypothetical protein
MVRDVVRYSFKIYSRLTNQPTNQPSMPHRAAGGNSAAKLRVAEQYINAFSQIAKEVCCITLGVVQADGL